MTHFSHFEQHKVGKEHPWIKKPAKTIVVLSSIDVDTGSAFRRNI